MAIIITMSESDRQYISGIPEFVELSTNKPSTMFYTIDGTTPDSSSDMYVDRVYLPTDGMAFELNVLAVSGDEESDIFSHSFYTDHLDIYSRRLVGDEGIVVVGIDDEVVVSLSIDSDGYASQETTIELSELDIKTSIYNRAGYENPDRTSDSNVNFQADKPTPSGGFGSVSSLNSNAYFDPKASMIFIDGSSQEMLDQQEVRVINRASGTISPVSGAYSDHLMQSPPVTGNLVRSMYNPRTGIYISYYYDH